VLWVTPLRRWVAHREGVTAVESVPVVPGRAPVADAVLGR
jgi:hypothetical protein